MQGEPGDNKTGTQGNKGDKGTFFSCFMPCMNFQFNFKTLTGDSGDQGPSEIVGGPIVSITKGMKGVAGEKGEPGDLGIKGETGAKGPQVIYLILITSKLFFPRFLNFKLCVSGICWPTRNEGRKGSIWRRWTKG